MDPDDVVVIDDDESQPGPSTAPPSAQTAATTTSSASAPRHSSRLRASSQIQPPTPTPTISNDESAAERTTRAGAKAKVQPRLKLKLSEKLAAQAPGMSFLGQYDRELDSDNDEELAFEEQFILRVPPGEDCEKLRKMVSAREVSQDVWFKFKDSRRGVFHVGNNLYSSKLVDMPCIIESQKTLDNKQMFKVSDICQMLVVEGRIENEEVVTKDKSFNIDEFIWPHGITPPLAHVRKRRFRKRINKRTIETVEQEVERLLETDTQATEIKYELLENVNPDLSDSEFIERDEDLPLDAPTPAISDMGDPFTPGVIAGDEGEGDEDGEDDQEDGDGDGAEGDIDEELAAELDLALGDDGDEEDEDEDDSDEEDEEDDDDDEQSQTRRLLNEEIRDLEAAVKKKGNEIASSANPLIRKRFEDALRKLTSDLEMKLAQRDEMDELQRMQKEGIQPSIDASRDDGDESEGERMQLDAVVTGGAGGAAVPSAGPDVAEEDDDDLFGPGGDDNAMQVD